MTVLDQARDLGLLHALHSGEWASMLIEAADPDQLHVWLCDGLCVGVGKVDAPRMCEIQRLMTSDHASAMAQLGRLVYDVIRKEAQASAERRYEEAR